ncbi:hypothetical protein M426DRAFT_75440 [Hypoxylon sp. CI-4A]|nr:hypothetical protein M426DRAFT_75440 [Hypoxylon sp. CI-4A]
MDEISLTKLPPTAFILGIPLVTYCLWSLFAYLSSPLRQYPGPFLARWTRLWYLYHAWTGKIHTEIKRLHAKHGPIVRITPHILDVDMPEMIPTIYNRKEDWPKTEFYHGSSALVDGKIVLNLFSETDPDKHARERKPISKYYSVLGITGFESHMDKIINKFCYELETRFIDGPGGSKVFDIGRWINYYTWDAVGQLTYSKPLGYLEKGRDFDGTLRNSEVAMDYFTIVSTMPFLDHVLDKNRFYRMGPPGFNTVTKISIDSLVARYQGTDKETHDDNNPDFLDKFLEAKANDPDTINDAQIISWLMNNMIAGADTTTNTIKSVLYHSLKHPHAWKKLSTEILAANLRGRTPPPAYKDVRVLPYVDAVVREALRLLPGVCMTLERHVPRGGYSFRGTHLPEGVKVGVNPYITNRNAAVYGADAEHFRPERWLRDEAAGESEESFQARLHLMNRCDMSFGGGSRVCLGKNVGMFETYKVLATLVTLYEIELAEEQEDWEVTVHLFPRPEGGLKVKMTRRR